MSLPLKELRLWVTPETYVWLKVKSRTTGDDMQEIARDILKGYVAEKIHEATLLTDELRASGLSRTVKESDRGTPE